VAGYVRDNTNNSVVVARLNEAGQLVSPIVTADGPLSFCDGGVVKLTSSETGAVQWYRNNVSINGATGTVYSATTSGSYTVSVNNAVGCGVSSPVSVTVVTLDTPSITANGPVSFCIGGSVLLYSDVFGGNQWYKDGVAILDSTANTLWVKTTGNYTVKVHLYGCESSASNVIPVTVNSNIPDAPSITAIGNTTFCSGATVVLTSNSGSNNQWYLNGLAVSGATTASIQATTGGNYTARVIVLGCVSPSSNAIDVTVNASPPKPPLNWDGIKFSTNSGYAHYQWYQNDTAIAGATMDTYTPGITQFGDYKVVVTDNNNCFNTSDKKPYRVTAVSEIAIGDATLRCYPNPAKASLNVDISAVGIRKLQASLYDVSARLLQRQLLNQYHNVMDIQRIPAGLYQLVVDNGIEKTAIKVIVIK
jgi:hypothetical protein